MIHNLKPYPAYKDSGVPWLGEVPEHWNVLPNRALFEEVKERDCPDEQLLSVTISQGVIQQTDLLTNSSKKDSSNEDKTKYKLVKPGDIAYNKMRAWQGSVGVSKYRGIVSPAYVIVRPRDTQNPNYFHYLLRTPAFAKEAERWSYGITSDQWSLRPEHFKMIYCSLPPKEEQSAIVRYLDYIDRRIRRYIRAKKKLIKLLEEQKQAIIQQAVTRGLDPNVKLKPSGVEWLGDVPEYWDVVSLRLRYAVQLGKMLDSKKITGEHLIPYLRNTDVQWDRINTDNLPKMDIRPDEYSRYTVKTGDLLVCEGGEVGRAAIWVGSDTIIGYQKALHRLRPLKPERDEPRFIYFVLFDAAKRGIFHADGSENTIAHLTGEKLRRYRFVFPSVNEQKAIVKHIDLATENMNQSIYSIEREISLLREYRTRLIADVVTGKLDVREAAANLPEETDETEALDDVLAEDDELENNEIENEQAGELEEEVLA